jgi:hypothetical protein
MIAGFLSSMAFIRHLLRSLLSIIDRLTLEDACALLSAAGVTIFEIDKLLPENEHEEDEFAVDQPQNALAALCLEGGCPAVAWQCREVSPTFLWRKESDLNVRDWIYLL